ncbi:MAG: RnfABCDGE type electron transport complex subunit D, partial [Deltaproteobacteria bacterium]|nr:RnfABCDGE type electron transport complex subunit D [Deltaproteobacteria bacterium]
MSRPSSTDLVLSTAPFVSDHATTPRVMIEVLLAALVALAGACLHFGISAVLVVGAATAGAMVTEWFFTRTTRPSPLWDNSALLTGVLLGLTLPPSISLWMAFLGGIAAIGLGKLIWGGLGQNIFNPALIGRAFLQAAFPIAITTWARPIEPSGFFSIPKSLLAWPLMKASEVDAVTGATPLGLAKFEDQMTEALSLLLGHTGGSLGETTGLILILCGLWLGVRRVFDWRLPVSTILFTALFSGLLWVASPESYPNPLFMVLSGGLLFGAVFMVTDPVTTPTTPRGAWLFGAGVGLLVVVIRVWGGL